MTYSGKIVSIQTGEGIVEQLRSQDILMESTVTGKITFEHSAAVYWAPRPVGMDWGMCDIRGMGNFKGYTPSISGLVKSRVDGAKAVQMFGRAFLDDREHDHIQVKIGAEDPETLEVLRYLVERQGNMLTPLTVKIAVFIGDMIREGVLKLGQGTEEEE